MSEKEDLPGQMDIEEIIARKKREAGEAIETPAEPADFIEDIEERGPKVVDPDHALTDEQLELGGLTPVRSFVRTKASKNALRVRKAKEKREAGETGPARKQLNLQAPPEPEARETLKEISAALLKQQITIDDLAGLLKKQGPLDPQSSAAAPAQAKPADAGELDRWKKRAQTTLAQLEVTQAALEAAEAELERLKSRPWWKFWA